ncbi:MAG: hypothetical protein ACLQVD_07505 [Capsulimonadaceae bacterium]
MKDALTNDDIGKLLKTQLDERIDSDYVASPEISAKRANGVVGDAADLIQSLTQLSSEAKVQAISQAANLLESPAYRGYR